MINHAALPSFETIFAQAGLKPLKRGRGPCPFCESSTGFSCNEEKGFHCFACGVHGDKIRFVQQLHRCDFKDALRYFGIEKGKPPKRDAARARQRAAIVWVREWIRTTGRRLRDEFYTRQRVISCAQKRLEVDPEDQIAWELLRIAYDGECNNEHLLDEILCRTDEERLEAWRKYQDVL